MSYYLYSVLLWGYTGFLVFVWFIARITPEWAVLIRIASSVISDVVWIPACFVMLFRFFDLSAKKAFNIIFPPNNNVTRIIITAVSFGLPALIILFFFGGVFKLIPILFFAEFTRLVWILLKKRPVGYLLKEFSPSLLIILIISFYYGRQLIPSFGKEPDGNLKVMTYNILGNAAPESRKDIIKVIKSENPDILCLVEYNPEIDPNILDPAIKEIYPYSVRNRSIYSKLSGEVVFSKFPMVQKKNVLLKHNEFGYLNFVFAEIYIKGRKINVIDVHLTTSGHLIDDVIRSKLKFTEKLIVASQFEITKDRKKYNEACSLYDYIEHFRDPTIICGDFNDTPNSRVYNLFARKYNNAFSIKGWGVGSTFGRRYIMQALRYMPFVGYLSRDIIRLDHIFTTKDIRVISSNIVDDANGSDHKPVVSVFRLE